jgi:hypothetical protein
VDRYYLYVEDKSIMAPDSKSVEIFPELEKGVYHDVKNGSDGITIKGNKVSFVAKPGPGIQFDGWK